MELIFNKLTKKFKDKIAVNEISTKISTGVYGLLGANGAGKTTLMRMICGVINPTSGEILLNNNNIRDLGEEYRSLLGYLPQDFGYYPDFTAKEFMYYIAALKGISINTAKVRTKELLQMVALSEVANKKIGTFSGGMKQRLGVAQAILNDPKILILDEPTAGLDPKERVRFRNLIANFAKDKIVILSTHIVSDIEYIADKIFVMKQGNFIMQGTADELMELAEGCVWECIVDSKEVEKYQSKYCIANLHHLDEKVKLRIISKVKPIDNAVPEYPTLEDLYLYYFQDEQSSKGDAIKW